MPKFSAVYGGRGLWGNQKLLNVRGAGRERDHCWLHPRYSYIPSSVPVGAKIQFMADVREYEDRWTVEGIDEVWVMP